jgi:hypothetical protein
VTLLGDLFKTLFSPGAIATELAGYVVLTPTLLNGNFYLLSSP